MTVRLPVCRRRLCGLLPRRRLLVIVVLLLLFWALSMVLHNVVLPASAGYYNDDCYLTEEQRERMRFVLRHVVGFLNEENVTYWLDFGTLLGAVREGDIIAHDGDIDLSRVADDAEQDSKMISRLRNNLTPVGIQVNAAQVTYKDVILDMFRWKNFNTSSGETVLRNYYGPSHIAEIISNYIFPTEIHPRELFPLRQLSMFGLTVKIPNRVLDFLKRRFPLTWTYKSVPFKWKCYVGA